MSNRVTVTQHTPGYTLAGLVLLSLNLRPAASAVGPLLGGIQQDLGLSDVGAGLLTALPALCFAAFGALAPQVSNRLGPHRTIVAAITAMVLGQAARTVVDSAVLFLLATIVALAGMATANVLLPSLVRRHFPQRVGFVTALYSTGLNLGTALAAMFSAPLATWLGSWRHALWAWVLMTVLTYVPWLPLLRHDRGHRPESGGGTVTMTDIARTRLGWYLALFFGFQSTQAYAVFGWLATIYVDAGAGVEFAGWMVGICTGLSIPLAYVVPTHVARSRRPAVLLVIMCAVGASGYAALIIAPMAAPWLWACLVAVGLSGFPFFLAILAKRGRTSAGTAALSAFSQSVGYLIAAAGPLLIGVLRQVTGGFTAPLLLLIVILVPLTIFGALSSRPRYIEDELPQR